MNATRLYEPANGPELRTIVAKRTKTSANDWFLTFRAREAMQVVFEEIRKKYGEGDVVLQPFTCSTVPESVIAGGLNPFYCDISPDDLSLDPDLFRALAEGHGTRSSKPQNVKAVVVQHTFGMFDDAQTAVIRDKAHKAGMLLIEDCAHRAARIALDRRGKAFADISVHSFGVEKMLRTNFGGIVWISPDMEDKELRRNIIEHLASLPPSDTKISKSIESYGTRIRILNHLPMKIRRPLRDLWVKEKAFVPAVDKSELAGGTLLAPSVPDDEVIRRILAAFSLVNSNEAQRQVTVSVYAEELSRGSSAFDLQASDDTGYFIPAAATAKMRPLLWFPVVVRTSSIAEKIVARLAENGYYSSTWGRPLLFPGVTEAAGYNLNQAVKDCPAALRCSEGIVLLPTLLSAEDARKVTGIFRSVTGEEQSSGEFVPILLGTETNVYNMARSFYEAYGIRSVAYGRVPLPQSSGSRFVDVICNRDFADPENFVRVLNMEAHKYRGRKAVLISCGDNYTRILARVKDQLDPVYIPVCPDYEIVDSVNSKVRFYQYCEEAGIPYPETVVIDSAGIPALPFGFPLVLKPDDADDYYAHPFEGQKKAFILNSQDELARAAADTYAAGYTGRMLIQEFIPGADANMRVVNGYKRSDGKVALMSMGQPLLEDYYPMAIGNYNVIYVSGDDRVYDTVEKLLGAIPYLGYFNLDLKYDSRDGIFKVFDFNPRMGRSSYYVTLAGHNLASCVVDDVVLGKPAETVRAYDEYLWTDIPAAIIPKYVEDKEQLEKAVALIKEGRFGGTFRGADDRSVKRMLIQTKADLRSIRNYRRYFVPKESE